MTAPNESPERGPAAGQRPDPAPGAPTFASPTDRSAALSTGSVLAGAAGRSRIPGPTAGAVRPLSGFAPIPTRPGMSRCSYVGPGDGVRELFVEELHFEHGAEIPLHQHSVVESFVVTVGELTFRLGDETMAIGPEHTVTIPPNTPHGVVNASARIARAICAAPFDHDRFYREATTYLEGAPRD